MNNYPIGIAVGMAIDNKESISTASLIVLCTLCIIVASIVVYKIKSQ